MKVVIETKKDPKILKEWLALWENSLHANFTNSPYWFLAVMESFNYKDFVIIGVYKNDSLVGVGSLFKIKKYGVTVYTVAPELFVCGDPFLYNPINKKVSQIFGKELLKLGVVYFNNIPQEYLYGFGIAKYSEMRMEAPNYYLQIVKDVNGEAVIRNKKKLLQRSKTIEDKLKMRSFNGTFKNLLEIVFAIDENSNKNVYGYNAFSDKQTKFFYSQLEIHFQKYLSLFVLYHENRPIAYQLGFLIKDTFFCSQKAFVKEYKAYSIGRVLVIKMIEYFSEIGVNKIDFGSGEDEMKRSLTDFQRPLYSLVVSKNSIIRNYIATVGNTRNWLYHKIHANRKYYTMYRKVRNIVIPK